MAAAMDGENGRRVIASQRPGHGAAVPTAQSPTAAGTGISDVPMPAVGLGYDVALETSEAQVAAYSTPNYADPSVGGAGFAAGRKEAPVRMFTVQRSRPVSDGVTVVSPSLGRPGLLARLRARFRK